MRRFTTSRARKKASEPNGEERRKQAGYKQNRRILRKEVNPKPHPSPKKRKKATHVFFKQKKSS
jgi:hypothetical protein